MQTSPIIFIETLGCAKNEVDSRKMKERILAAGYRITDDLEVADVAIVNTCSFIQAATEESIDAVLDVAPCKGQSRKIVVAGCMPARYGSELDEAFPEASSFVPCSKEDDIVSILNGLTGWDGEEGAQLKASMNAVSAYLKISDGCDRWCTFCTIPRIRGRYHSFAYEEIVREADGLASSGVREIVLIGQDTSIWGHDLDGDIDLAWLLRKLSDAFPDIRFRVMYTEPEGVTDELLDVMASRENICDYLDIPLQHVSPHIIEDMGRKGSYEQFEGLAKKVRERIPGIALRTTLMCGFPGETDEDFEELLDFVRLALFDYIGVFAYSQEDGTKAARLPMQVSEDVKEARARELRDEADSVSAAMIASRIGTSCSVLVEGIEDDGQLFGRAECQGPEVDGVTYIDSGAIGSIVDVIIEDTLLYDMEGPVL